MHPDNQTPLELQIEIFAEYNHHLFSKEERLRCCRHSNNSYCMLNGLIQGPLHIKVRISTPDYLNNYPLCTIGAGG